MTARCAVGAHVMRVSDDAASGDYSETDYAIAFGEMPVIT